MSGKEVLKMLLGPPIGLRKGARAINVFNGAREFIGTLRAAGAKGVCITIYLQDGLLHTALSRLFVGRHEVYYQAGFAEGDDEDELHDGDWVISIKCSSHPCSNSLDKAFRVIPDKKKLLMNSTSPRSPTSTVPTPYM